MYREIIAGLASWKDKADRQPAVVTGAVSVGKTTAVKEFAERFYNKLIIFDLQKAPSILSGELTRKNFDEKTQAYMDVTESKEDILVVIDHLDTEKVGNHQAAEVLRFICYNLMDYNICVITSLNVWRIFSEGLLAKFDLFEMYPVSLREFLIINRDRELLECVEHMTEKELTEEQMAKMLRYMKVYLFTGGMPLAIQTYMDTRDIGAVTEAKKKIAENYLGLIEKIPDIRLRKKAKDIYLSICEPLQREDKRYRYRKTWMLQKHGYDEAVEWLCDKGLVLRMDRCVSAGSGQNGKEFRLYYNDIGILTWFCKIRFADIAGVQDIYQLGNGALMEQAVLQQLRMSELSEVTGFLNDENEKSEVTFLCRSEKETVPVRTGRKENVSVQYPMTVCITWDKAKVYEKQISIPLFAVWNL